MRILLFIFLLPLALRGQNLNDRYNLFLDLANGGNYSDALGMGSTLMTELEKTNRTDTIYSNVAYYMGQIYFSQQNYEEAAEWAKKARIGYGKLPPEFGLSHIAATYFEGICYGYQLDYVKGLPFMEEAANLCKKSLGEAHPYTLHYTNNYAHTLNAAGSYYKADQIFTNNWEIAKKNYKSTDSMYMVVSNAVSQFYTATGNYAKSEPFFLDALAMYEKAFGRYHQYYYDALEQTRQFYMLAKWYDKAEKIWIDIIDVFKKTGDQNDYYTLMDAFARFYLEGGMYEKAEKQYAEVQKLAEKKFGKKSADYAQSLNNLAVTYEKQGKNAEAEKIYLQCLDIKAAVYKKQSNFYAITLLNLSVLYDNMGQYKKAEEKITEALKIFESVNGKDNVLYAQALANAGAIYSSAGKQKETLKMLEESIAIYKKNNAAESPECLSTMNNAATMYAAVGNYDRAEATFSEVITLQEKTLGPEHTELGITLFNLGQLKTERGDYIQAEKLLTRAFAIQTKALGNYHLTCANVKQSLASLYASSGRYSKAEEAYQEADKIYRKTIGNLHPEYAVYLANVGLFYLHKGDYEKADRFFGKSMFIMDDAYGKESEKNIALNVNMGHLELAKHNFKQAEKLFSWSMNKSKEVYGDKHPDYAASLNNMAHLYYELGNYTKSQEMYEQALALRKNIYGEQHREYAISLNNLGTAYLARASYSKDPKERDALSLTAIVQFKRAFTVDSVLYGINNPEVAGNLNNMAEAYRLRNEPQKAEELYLKSISIEQNYYGNKNAKSAQTMHNLALLYCGMNELDKAEKCANSSIDMFTSKFAGMCPQSAGAVSTLAYIQDLKGDAHAAEHYQTALMIQQASLERNFTFLSEEEKEQYLNSISLYQQQYNGFALKRKDKINGITETVYNNELKRKGALLRSSEHMKNSVLNSGNENMIALYNRWNDTKQQLSALYSIPVEDRKIEYTELEKQANEMEKSLVAASSEIDHAISTTKITWFDIREKLQQGQVAVEFIRFVKDQLSGEEVYCALIIKKESRYPEMIELCSAAELEKVLGNSAANNLSYISQLYDPKNKLYQTVWAPLEAQLAGIKEVFYSPVGLLHKISFASLRTPEKKYIADQYSLHALNTTASIVTSADPSLDPSKADLAIFGGITYTTNQTKNEIWKYLPGTMNEANSIKKILTKSGMMANAFTGFDATEEKLKQLDGKKSPAILHVATHGFFFGDPVETKKQMNIVEAEDIGFRGGARGTKTLVENTNPLMRSGIVLAGANDVWNENNNNPEDGVLTAYEVSLMNLQNTKLTVLSACETGLGDIKGSEGVYGLQRAFRIAGVKQLIMSLWQVPDKETEEFMSTFYANLVNVKNTRKAFEMTQKTMRLKYEPYFWGAFVLIE